MSFFGIFKSRAEQESEYKQMLDSISAILFPPFENLIDKNGDVFHIDRSADSNLDTVCSDLEDGNNDKVAWESLRCVNKRLNKVRSILRAYPKMDKRAKYIIVEDFDPEVDREIIPMEDSEF